MAESKITKKQQQALAGLKPTIAWRSGEHRLVAGLSWLTISSDAEIILRLKGEERLATLYGLCKAVFAGADWRGDSETQASSGRIDGRIVTVSLFPTKINYGILPTIDLDYEVLAELFDWLGVALAKEDHCHAVADKEYKTVCRRRNNGLELALNSRVSGRSWSSKNLEPEYAGRLQKALMGAAVSHDSETIRLAGSLGDSFIEINPEKNGLTATLTICNSAGRRQSLLSKLELLLLAAELELTNEKTS